MTIAAFTGYHPEVGIGHIEQGLSKGKGVSFMENDYR